MISLIVILFLATIWNAFTIIYGTLLILPSGPFQTIAALLFSALIIGFVLNTHRILTWRLSFNGVLLRILWFIAVGYNFYTSWIANSDLIIQDQSSTALAILVVGLTLLATASPLLLSALWSRRTPKVEPKT